MDCYWAYFLHQLVQFYINFKIQDSRHFFFIFFYFFFTLQGVGGSIGGPPIKKLGGKNSVQGVGGVAAGWGTGGPPIKKVVQLLFFFVFF